MSIDVYRCPILMEASGNGLELGGLRSVEAWEQAPAVGVASCES